MEILGRSLLNCFVFAGRGAIEYSAVGEMAEAFVVNERSGQGE